MSIESSIIQFLFYIFRTQHIGTIMFMHENVDYGAQRYENEKFYNFFLRGKSIFCIEIFEVKCPYYMKYNKCMIQGSVLNLLNNKTFYIIIQVNLEPNITSLASSSALVDSSSKAN